jgi:hypothetical protein
MYKKPKTLPNQSWITISAESAVLNQASTSLQGSIAALTLLIDNNTKPAIE